MMLEMVKDDWVLAAMTDDSVVVELLVRLKKQTHHVVKSAAASSSSSSLRWGIRQPRSKSMRCDAVSMRRKDGPDSATNSLRASPTTPLSWSGGDGSAATADDETSRQHTSAVRSKDIATNECTSNTAKRSRKKKTFAELKEEEGLLLKERIHLNKELETLRANYEIQSARNDNLKRIKLDLGKNPSETHLPQSESCEAHEAVPARNSLCLLPDLNMMPAEDDSTSETLYGLS